MSDTPITYATVQDVEDGFRAMTADERTRCAALIIEAAVQIDAIAQNAPADRKKVVTCRIVRRAIGNSGDVAPMGATQGSVSALGYSQSWTFGSGSTGEIYIGRAERQILGLGNRAGIVHPLDRGVLL